MLQNQVLVQSKVTPVTKAPMLVCVAVSSLAIGESHDGD